MIITKEILTDKIITFLNHEIQDTEFAIWAENAMLNDEYEEKYFDTISDALSRIGVINVKSFELKVADFLNILINLEYMPTFGRKPYQNKKEKFMYI